MFSDTPTKYTTARSIDGIVVRDDLPGKPDGVVKRNRRKSSRRSVLAGASVILAVVISVGVVTSMFRGDDSLPASFVKNAGFPLYFPSPMAGGYTYQKGSAKMEGELALYTLKNGTSAIIVSEQAAPSDPPDLTKLLGFTSLRTVAGNAAVGTTSAKQPIVVIISNTTLITMTGNVGLPSDAVSALAQNMRSL